jgi:hypothetical protein
MRIGSSGLRSDQGEDGVQSRDAGRIAEFDGVRDEWSGS